MPTKASLSKEEKELIEELRLASDACRKCSEASTHDNTVWQLIAVGVVLRDRMRGVAGGTVKVAAVAIAGCIAEVKQVTSAAAYPGNGPDYDRVVIEGDEAIRVIDASDTA